jgi:hypothetical protein
MVDDVVKIRKRKAPDDHRVDRVGARTVDALRVQAVPPGDLANHLDEPLFGTPGRKTSFLFVAHQSDSSEGPAPFVPALSSFACSFFSS